MHDNRSRRTTLLLALLGGLALSGCGHLPASRLSTCAALPVTPGTIAPPAGSTTLDVLTYNIEGLAWPARSGRSANLARIGQILADLHASGTGPDVVLFQEAFSRSAVRSVARAGYPSLATGPTRTQRSSLRSDTALPGKPRTSKGEIGLRLLASGLIIASRYPIIATVSEPFSRSSCAGFDCLANKGVVLATIIVPGVPGPIQILNTHMNAQNASGVAPKRHLASHRVQTAELSQFMRSHLDYSQPVILGGDFNMRRAPQRFELFNQSQPLELVHQYCLQDAHRCDVRMSWDGDEPWMDTQDLQLFASGRHIEIRPIRVEAMFDGRPDSPVLSDHDGFRVTYRLAWRGGESVAPSCP